MHKIAHIGSLSILLLLFQFPCAQSQGNWNLVRRLPQYLDLNDASIVNRSLIFVIGDHGVIRRSADSGKTWHTIPTHTDESLTGVEFINSRKGVIVGTRGTLMLTEDGGDSWKACVEPKEVAFRDFNGITFTQGTLIVVGEQGVLWRSTDTGSSWEVVESPVESDLYEIDFLEDEGIGLIVGDDGSVLKSDDAGYSWRLTRNGTEDLRALCTINGTAFAASSNGYLMASSDAGETWNTRSLSQGYEFTGIYMLNSLYGYSLGNSNSFNYRQGMPRVTTDGGVTWNDFGSGSVRMNRGGELADSTFGVFVGDAGNIIIYERPQNRSLLRISADPQPFEYRDLSIDAEGNGLGVGNVVDVIQEGHTTLSRDHSLLSSGLSEFLPYPANTVLRLPNSDTWIIGMDSGSVLRRTSDTGSWQNVSPDPLLRYIDITALNDTMVVLVGLPSSLFISSDSGGEWQTLETPAQTVTKVFRWDPETLGTYSPIERSFYRFSVLSGMWTGPYRIEHGPLKSIVVIDDVTAFGFGSQDSPQNQGNRQNDLIVGTTDGGISWEVLLNAETGSGSYGLDDGAMWDRKHGVAVGWGGKILVTTDGWKNWSIVDPPADIFPFLSPLSTVVMTGPQDGLIVSRTGDLGGALIARFSFSISDTEPGIRFEAHRLDLSSVLSR